MHINRVFRALELNTGVPQGSTMDPVVYLKECVSTLYLPSTQALYHKYSLLLGL